MLKQVMKGLISRIRISEKRQRIVFLATVLHSVDFLIVVVNAVIQRQNTAELSEIKTICSFSLFL